MKNKEGTAGDGRGGEGGEGEDLYHLVRQAYIANVGPEDRYEVLLANQLCVESHYFTSNTIPTKQCCSAL